MNIVLFDGVCNLCNNTVLFLIKHDSNNQLHFAAQQTTAGQNILKEYGINENCQSVIFIKNDLTYYKSDAIIEICKLLTGWPRIFIAGSIFPKFFRNWIYNIFAKYRYKVFGKNDVCSMPSKLNEHKFIL